MAIVLRCPGCGKMYRLADDRAGKHGQMPVRGGDQGPGRGLHGRSRLGGRSQRRLRGRKGTGTICAKHPPGRSGKWCLSLSPHQAAPPSREPPPPSGPSPRDENRKAGRSSVLSSWLASLAKIELRRLAKKEPWRAVFGLAAVAYGALAVAVLLAGISPALGSLSDLLFGDTTSRLARAGVAAAIAVGGLFILKKDKRGPACAGLAAALYCFFPMWGLLPELRDALRTQQLASFISLVAEYAVPIALMVWCFKEETRRQGWKTPT